MSSSRKRYVFSLQPLKCLAPDLENPSQWQVTGDAPEFELEPVTSKFPSGWVIMNTTLIRRGVDFTAGLFVDVDDGSAATLNIPIPATRKGRVNHVFKLPVNIQRMRWAPMRGEGTVVHGPLTLTELTQVERIALMAGWVAHDLWKFRRTGQATLHGLSVRRLFFDLQGAYDASAKLRFNFAPPSYMTFVQQVDNLHDADITAIRELVAAMRIKPTISVWATVENSISLGHIQRALGGLRDQVYPCWNLSLFVSGPLSPDVQTWIDSTRATDTRIKISLAADACLNDAVFDNSTPKVFSEFVYEMDLADQLALQALYHVALEINLHPNVELLYSDEDCLSPSGQRRSPYFKCDWNPELFYSRNLLGNFAVYRRSAIEAAGGIASKFPAARRLDLALRCIARIPPQNIRHIPFVLCHRGRSAEWEGQEPYENDASGTDALAAMRAHFNSHYGVRVEPGSHRATFRVHYPVPDPAPLVSLLIPTRDALEVLQKCIKSVLAHTDYPNWEIIVLDNQTTDPAALRYLADIAQDARIRVVRYDLPFNYSAINNFGVGVARGEIIGLLNNDVEVIHADWLTELVSHAVRPEIGAVGAKLLYSDGYVQHAGVVVGLGGLAGHVHRFIAGDHPGYAGLAQLTQAFSAVTAACLLVRRDVYLAVGGLDEENLTVAYNDVDLCLRIRDAGFRNVWTPHALLYHHESYSRGDDQESPAKRARFETEKAYMLKRWHTDKVPDPFYSPNLTTDKEDYSIAHVPRVVRPWLAYQASAVPPKKGWRALFRR